MSEPIWALGAMSGTSMDGVDAAMVLTDGERIHEFGASAYEPYSEGERAVLRAAQGRWQGQEGVDRAARVVEQAHARLLGQFEGADLVGFHGQTLAHDPSHRRTHQAGDGAALARALIVPVAWDFRTADVKLGGQGAPLAPFYHFALAKHIGAAAPLAFLNLGGIGNITWVDPAASGPEDEAALLAFDTGPANAPIDDLIFERTGDRFDQAGKIAASGQPDIAVVKAALARPFFAQKPPKSLDRGDFSDLVAAVAHLSLADGAATLVAISVASVARAMEHLPHPPLRVLVGGGGRLNLAMMDQMNTALDCPVDGVEAAGLDGDMLEAQAFAHLAMRIQKGLATSGPTTTGVAANVGGGTISTPGV